MNTNLQENQKVLTPEGEGTVVAIIEERIVVKLYSGEQQVFYEDEVLDDSDAG